eukprot:2842291-Rhodomonas_salina.1
MDGGENYDEFAVFSEDIVRLKNKAGSNPLHRYAFAVQCPVLTLVVMPRRGSRARFGRECRRTQRQRRG